MKSNYCKQKSIRLFWHKDFWRVGFFMIFSAICALCLTACGTQTAPPRSPAQMEQVDWPMSLYFGNYGKISFCYEEGVDEVTVQQDTNEVLQAEDENPDNGVIPTQIHQIDQVAVARETCYSIGISYEADTKDLEERQNVLLESKSEEGNLTTAQNDDARSLSKDTIGGYDCRVITLQGADGSAGRILFGNTESGYFEVYYVLSAQATNEEAGHMQDILDSIRFGQYTENDLVFDDNSTIYVPIGA